MTRAVGLDREERPSFSSFSLSLHEERAAVSHNRQFMRLRNVDGQKGRPDRQQ